MGAPVAAARSALAVTLVLCACAGEPGRELALDTGAAGPAASVVDSVLPMDVMLARFRADLAEPDGLAHRAETRDALIGRVVSGLAAGDTAGLAAVAVDRAEFAWLYFPSSAIARPPYELPPALAWFQLQEANRKGVLRALRELGGRPLDLRSYECNDEPRVEGGNRIWLGCTVRVARGREEPVTLRLFDSILERGGRFAILSFANDF